MDPEPKFLCNSGTVNLQKITNFQKKMKILRKVAHFWIFHITANKYLPVTTNFDFLASCGFRG